MSSDAKTPRREFLRRAGAGAAGAAFPFPTIVSGRALGRDGAASPSERIRLGFIGVGNQGTNNLKDLLKLGDAEVVAVCDVDKERLAKAAKLAGQGGREVKAVGDYRRLLDDKSMTRAYIEELLPDVLDGRIEPGRVFDRTVDLDGVADGYRAMNDREALKVMVRP